MYQDNNYSNSGNYSGGNYSSEYQTYEYDRSGEQERRNCGYDYELNNKKKSGRGFKAVVGTLVVVALVGTGTYAGFRMGNSAVIVPEPQTTVEQQLQPEIAATVLPEKQQPVTQQSETVRTVITDVTNVVEAVMPSVVSITNTSIAHRSLCRAVAHCGSCGEWCYD